MALVLGTSTAQIPSSIEDLVRQSELVLEGEVIQKEAYWSPDRAYIYTENLIRVDKLYKGQLMDTVVSIITKGGKVGDDIQIHTHHATLPKGQIGIFFAKEEPKLKTGRKNFQLTKEEGGFLLIEDRKLNPYVLLETGKKFSYKKLIETIMLETKKPILTRDLIEYSMKLGNTIDCEILPFAENLKTIDFTFDNVYLTGNNQFVEFDIMAKVNTYGLKFGKAELFVTYNKEPFGEFVVQNGLIEVQKETIVSDVTYSMTHLDFDTTSLQIKIEPSGISNNFHTMTTVKEKLVHVKIAISDFTQIGQISFDNIDISGRVWYYCDGEFYLFDEVNLGNPIFGVNPNPENATGITYTFENIGYNESSSQYNFDIYATATGETYFSDAYLYISFNIDAFLPNQATNGNVVFLPGPLISNDVVYNFQMTDQSSNSILLLIYSEFPIEQTDLTVLGTTPVKVGTMYLKVSDCEKPANLHFDEEEMQGLSYHNVGTMPFPVEIYDPIIASDTEEAKICCTDDPVITSISTPGSTPGNLMPIVAGMGNILTINGSNFGIYGTESKVRFQNGDAASGWMEAAPGDFIWGGVNHWSDTKIEVVVPSVDANENWKKPAASGKIQVRTDCGNETSDDELDIPYCIVNHRSGSFNQGAKLVLKKINGDGVLFQFSENVTSTIVREAFEEALQEWCAVTNINFFLSDTDSDKTSVSGTDGVNLIVMETVSSGAASFIFSSEHQVQCVNSSTNKIGYVMKDLDFRIDPSNTSLEKQQIKNRVLHELGHAHMLNHSKNLSNPQDLMYYQEVNPATVATIMGDDATGGNLVFDNSAQILNGASCGTPIGQGACGGSNSVSDIHKNEILEVFPNPFNTSIQVFFLTPNTSDLTFELFDQLGRQMILITEKGGQTEHLLVIPEETPKGMYMLKTTIGEKTIIATKIVKL